MWEVNSPLLSVKLSVNKTNLLGQQDLDIHDMYKNTRTLLYAHTEAFDIFSKSLQHHLRELSVNSQCNFKLLEPANLTVGYQLLSKYIQDSQSEGHMKPTWMERRLELSRNVSTPGTQHHGMAPLRHVNMQKYIHAP